MNKTCSNCKQEKPIEEFHQRKKGGHNSNCKICAISISKKWYAVNRHRPKTASRLKEYNDTKIAFFRSFIDNLKMNCGCVVCKEDVPCCLDFHHVLGEKENEVSYFVRSKSRKKIANELKKCVCVCSNCHRKIHAGVLTLSEEMLLRGMKTLSESFISLQWQLYQT